MKYLFYLSFAFLLVACTKESKTDDPVVIEEPKDPSTPTTVDGTIWKGTSITFTKNAGTDPTQADNQDRITDNVWITRNNSGQIYNIKSESAANQDTSPAGTKWAIGSIDDVNKLNFKSFRSAVGKPKNVVGKNLVLHLTEDNIYLSVKFTSWDSGKEGGFAYTRSTK